MGEGLQAPTLLSPRLPLPQDPYSRADSEFRLSFDDGNIRTGRKAPVEARAEVTTQGFVSLEMVQL